MTPFKVLYNHERYLLQKHDKLLWYLVLFMAFVAHGFYSDSFPRSVWSGPRIYVHILSLLMLFSLPLLAFMGFGHDRRRGSLTFMQSQPVDECVWYAGRLSAWLRMLLPLAGFATLWHVLAVRWFLLDAGVVFTTFLELFLVSVWVISLVLWCSSVARKLWLAVLAAYVVVMVFLGSTLLVAWTPWARLFSFVHRTDALRMGLLSLGDLWFWGGSSILMACATVAQLKKSRGSRQRLYWPVLWLAVLLAFQVWPVELDVTASRAYRPSQAFKEQAKKLQDPVIITQYLSPSLRFHADQQRLARLLKAYGRTNKQVYVRTVFIDDEEEARSYGLKELNPERGLDEPAIFAGLLATYQTKAVFEPILTQINALDTALVVMLQRLLNEALRVVVFTDEELTPEDFSLLRASLGREFALSFYAEQLNDWGDPVSLHELPADVYVVLSDGMITADMAADLWTFSQQGAGLVINSTQVITPLFEGAMPQRINASPLQQLLKRQGLEVGSDLLLDPDGLLLHSRDASGSAVKQHFRPWVMGRRVKGRGIHQFALGINPLFSVPLQATSPRWRPWLITSPATYLQKGVVDLSAASLQHKAIQEGTGPHTVAMVHEGKKGAGTVLVMGSHVWVSDSVEMAGAWDNIEGFKQVLRQLGGQALVAQANTRFDSFTHQRKPYALHEDAFAVMWRTTLAFFIMVAWAVLSGIKGRRR